MLMLLAILLPIAAGASFWSGGPRTRGDARILWLAPPVPGGGRPDCGVHAAGKRYSSCCPWGAAVHRLPGGWAVLYLCRAGVRPVAPGLSVCGGVYEPGGRGEPVLCLLSGQPRGHFGHRFLRQCADDVLFYELLTLSTLPLVMHALDSKARYAGRIYLTYSMRAARPWLHRHGGAAGARWDVLSNSVGASQFQLARKIPCGRLMCLDFGFGVKAAVFPGHRWLLRASVAPRR